MNIKQTAEQIFQNAGITIGGNKPFDIQVHNQDIWDRIAAGGSIALGESYMDNSWDVENLAEFVFKIQTSNTDWDDIISKGLLLHWLRAKLMNLQIGKRAYDVGQAHYDIGNDLYQSMLDTRMIYTAAYWKDAHNLDEAQAAKLDLICKKLNLQPGQKILDIGCGWGGFMKFAAATVRCAVRWALNFQGTNCLRKRNM
jgi:cyclopropane-fatty-acyl-phospholipid synthase